MSMTAAVPQDSPPELFAPTITKLLVNYRSAHDLSSTQMAKNLGIGQRTYLDLENGAHPSFYTFRNIVLFFQLNAEQVMHYVLTTHSRPTGPQPLKASRRQKTKARAITGSIRVQAG